MTSAANGPIVRIVPVNGLLIDADIWGAAHDFHRFHLQRHALVLHGPGIATGLEVVAHEPPNRTMIIYPGLAIDPAGNTIILPECERYTIQTDQPGPVYIVLQFREVASGARGPAGPGVPTHMREAYRIQEHRTLPQEPHIELARLWLTGGRDPVADAPDPTTPGPNQIDLRYRIDAGGLARGDISIAHAWLDNMPAPLHPALPLNLVQTLATTTNYRTRFIGQLPPAEAAGKCSLLYVAGQGHLALSPGDIDGLRAFVDAGGIIFGDGVHADGQDEFLRTFYELAQKLGRALQPIDRAHPALRAPFVFEGPPAGMVASNLLVADGIIYSQCDYGSALDPARGGQALDRETLRNVVEMISNIAVYAYSHQRATQFAAQRRAP